CKIPLLPVLSIKARIAAIKDLFCGEGVGYGLSYTATENRKIAILPIGYADGIPRALSCGNGNVLINGSIAPIIGRICMDQTIIDIKKRKDNALYEKGYVILPHQSCRRTTHRLCSGRYWCSPAVLHSFRDNVSGSEWSSSRP